VSAELREVLLPLFGEIESLNERIKEYDERMEKIAKEVYPEVSLLQQVKGVGGRSRSSIPRAARKVGLSRRAGLTCYGRAGRLTISDSMSPVSSVRG
jgi:transposase